MTQQGTVLAELKHESMWNIPTNWSVKKLGLIATEVSQQVKPSDNSLQTYNYWSLGAIAEGQFEEPLPNYVLGSTIESTCIKFDNTHILYSKLRPYLNKIIVPSTSGIGTTEWVVIQPNFDVLDRKYLAYVLRSPTFLNYTAQGGKTSGARMPRLRKEALWDVEIPLPYPDDPTMSVHVQRAIVARIESLLAELREIRGLHATIDRDVAEVMDSVLREIFDRERTKDWGEDVLENLVEINARLVNPTLNQYKNSPHIYGKVMSEVTCKLLPYKSVAEDEMTSGKFLFSVNSVLYSKIRPKLRKVVLVDFQGLCSADVYPLEVKDSKVLVPEFLQWLLVSPHFTDYAVGQSGRARIPKINQDQLFAYRARYPGIDQQRQIAQYMLSVREEIEEMQSIQYTDKQLLNQAEQAILEQAFRGEL